MVNVQPANENYLQRIFLYSMGQDVPTNEFGVLDRHMPMLNTLSKSFSGILNEVGQTRRKQALMAWYKSIPELTAFINKVAGDCISRFHFETVKKNDSGRNNIMTAQKFAQEVVLSQIMDEQMADQLITGEGFGWIGKISKKGIKEAIDKWIEKKKYFGLIEKKEFSNDLLLELKQSEELSDISYIDEDLLKPRKYRSVPSTTIEIRNDQYDIYAYDQVIGINKIRFEPKEMVRYTLMKRDGRPSGFTPVDAVLTQLELLRQMWQNLLAVHKNGGLPDKIITLEDIRPGTPAYDRVKEQMQKYKQVESKHGSMLFTGKVGVHDLQQLDEMQFKESGLYITGLIAMQWGIPRSSIPYIVGGTNTKDDTGGNTERGYWEIIRRFQNMFADTMNTQLWIPYFGVKIVLDNPYFQLDTQEQTYLQLKLNNIKLTDEMMRSRGKMIKDNKFLKLLNYSDEEWQELPEELKMLNADGTLNNQLSESDANDTDAKKNVKDKKRDEQTATIRSSGKPTGMGKETYQAWDKMADKELLETKNSSVQDVGFDAFIQLYNYDKALSPGAPPRLFLRQNSDVTTMFFKSTDFVIKTVMGNMEYTDSRIKILNLDGGRIWRL